MKTRKQCSVQNVFMQIVVPHEKRYTQPPFSPKAFFFMTDAQRKITYLDGARLHRALVAGIRQVISRQEYLNNINVFPVPDRDTGTNMALTMNAIIEGTYTTQKPSVHALLDKVADCALNGSRGNSGAIIAQFFQGMSVGAKSVNRKMTTKNFVAAINTAVNHAHKALSEPREGTGLTVLRDFADEITQLQLSSDEDVDFLTLLHKGIQRAETSLANTRNQLKELKAANVVDAGAQGFVDFLNGIYHFIENGSVKALDMTEPPKIIHDVTEDLKQTVEEKYRFCTECLITGVNINHDALRAVLDELGNSVVIAGSSAKTKVHIHANDPNDVFAACRQFGHIQGEKADDMIHQQHSFNRTAGQVAILTDSGADLPEGMIDELDIHVVPILVNFGDQTFIDKVSMSPFEFYKTLENNPHHPKTSQPSFGDFHRQYQYLASHYDSVIAIHIPRGVSGTISASESAANKCANGTTISVVDSLNAATGLGLIVRAAAEAAKAGYSHEDILALIKDLTPKTKLYAAIPDLSFLAKGGRLSSKKKFFSDLLRLTPVISFTPEGKLGVYTKLLGRKNIPEKFASRIKKQLDSNTLYRLSIVHCHNKHDALAFEKALKRKLKNIESISIVDCGAALGAHVGPGPIGLGVQEYTALRNTKKES